MVSYELQVMAAAGTWKSTRGRRPAHSEPAPSLSAICRIVCSCTAQQEAQVNTTSTQAGRAHLLVAGQHGSKTHRQCAWVAAGCAVWWTRCTAASGWQHRRMLPDRVC